MKILDVTPETGIKLEEIDSRHYVFTRKKSTKPRMLVAVVGNAYDESYMFIFIKEPLFQYSSASYFKGSKRDVIQEAIRKGYEVEVFNSFEEGLSWSQSNKE